MAGKSRKKQPLNVQRIAQSAVALSDASGLDQLSMRKIAEHCGVEAMSLYHHIPSKQKLMQTMVDHLVESLPAVPASGKWRSDLRIAAWQWRDLAKAHPGTFPLLATRAQVAPALLERFATLLKSLVATGLPTHKAASLLSSFFFALNGYLLAAGKPFLFAEIPEPDEREVLNTDAHSILNTVPAKVWNLTSQRSFEDHVEFLLNGLASYMG